MKKTIKAQLTDAGVIERGRDVHIFDFTMGSIFSVVISFCFGCALKQVWGVNIILFTIFLLGWALFMERLLKTVLMTADNVYIVKRVIRG